MKKGIYIHIPFCKSICSYCDFPKIISKETIHKQYIDKLIEEIKSYNVNINNIKTVYIGGGTPNAISINLLNKLFSFIKEYLDVSIENTIELNPELVSDELCILLNKYKFNRVSLGVQTINDKNIKLLNRHHNKDIILNAIDLLKKHNITNINCDFIMGIPYQTLNNIKEDLEFIKLCKLNHVSYYSLILEEKTVLMHKINNKEIEILDDDIVADMYDYVTNYLKNMGYHHYEISNFCKPGYESNHNLLYWDSLEYYGFGCGASGYIDNRRYSNERVLSRYLSNNIVINEFIDDFEKKKEYFMLGLRKIDGVSIKEYINRFNSDPFNEFNLEKLVNNNLIEIIGDLIRIKEDKILLSNLVFEEFVG